MVAFALVSSALLLEETAAAICSVFSGILVRDLEGVRVVGQCLGHHGEGSLRLP